MGSRSNYPGIERKTLANGVEAFYGRIKVGNKWTWRRLKKARTWAQAAYEREVLQGVSYHTAGDGVNPFYRDYMPFYFDSIRRGLKRPEDKEYKLKLFLDRLGNKRLDEVLPSDLERYRIERLEHVSKSSVNRELGALKALYYHAWRDDRCNTNPATKIKAFREPRGRDRVLIDDEFDKLLGHLDEPVRGIVLCAWETGMRRGEILTIRTEQVIIDKRLPRIELTAEQTKTDQGRVVPLWEPLLDDIQRRLNGKSEWLYPNPVSGERYRDFKRHWATALRNAEIRDFKFHDLRHCAVTRMRRRGLSERVIMAITGHTSTQMHIRYSNVQIDDLVEAINSHGRSHK